jgi:general secretion pathway protein A
MYETFYGLRERPFDLTPNPRFLLMTARHQEALSTLEYGISGRKGVALVIGAAGTGKTTLVQTALSRQDGPDSLGVCLNNPTLNRQEFQEFLVDGFGLSPAATLSKTRLLRELRELLEARQASGAATALIIDEAQSLSDDLLQEVRLLANIETATDKLLPVMLVGQPDLSDRLNRPGMQQLKQRVALRAVLAPLDQAETSAYIETRIRVAGGEAGQIFTTNAVTAIFNHSGGIPRTISVICDNALVSGLALGRRPIGTDVVLEVCRDLDFGVAHPPAHVPRLERRTPPSSAPPPAPARQSPKPAGSITTMAPRTGRMFDLDGAAAKEEGARPDSGLSAPKLRIVFRTFNRSQATTAFGGGSR